MTEINTNESANENMNEKTGRAGSPAKEQFFIFRKLDWRETEGWHIIGNHAGYPSPSMARADIMGGKGSRYQIIRVADPANLEDE